MTDSRLKYEFAPTGGGDETGSNDPVTSTFKGDCSYHLARETLQNIIDAAIKFPVKAHFELFTMNSCELPQPDQLRKIFEECWRYVRGAPRAQDFFKKAWEDLGPGGIQIHILKISDFNTRGMVYKEGDKQCDYHSFMKAVGSSFKPTSGGGSWGLGKGSYFAASSYRTIFISSMYGDDKYVFQGKLRLSSHIDIESREIMQGNGSFGFPGQKPVTDPNLVPEIFKREEQGTDIYIVGFEESGKWEELITKSVLNNFWPAIYKHMLEVTIGGEEINSENLEQKLKKFYSLDDPDTDKNPNPFPYYYAYTTSQNRKIFEKELPVLGKTQLYVLENDCFSNRVVCFRSTGMIIQKLLKLSTRKYAAVFECDNEKGNQILQRMENPTHNEWRSHNDPDHIKPSKELVNAEKEINSFIKDNLRRLTKLDEGETLSIKGLEKYLGIPADENYVFGTPFEIAKIGELQEIEDERGPELGKQDRDRREVRTKLKPVMQTVETKEAEEGKGDEFFVGEGEGDGGYRESEEILVEGGGIKRRVAIPINYRTFAPKNLNKETEHLFIIRSKSSKKIDIEVRAAVDDGTLPVSIKQAEDINGNPLKVDGYWIKAVDFRVNDELRAKIKFETDEKLALNLRAYEHK